MVAKSANGLDGIGVERLRERDALAKNVRGGPGVVGNEVPEGSTGENEVAGDLRHVLCGTAGANIREMHRGVVGAFDFNATENSSVAKNESIGGATKTRNDVGGEKTDFGDGFRKKQTVVGEGLRLVVLAPFQSRDIAENGDGFRELDFTKQGVALANRAGENRVQIGAGETIGAKGVPFGGTLRNGVSGAVGKGLCHFLPADERQLICETP